MVAKISTLDSQTNAVAANAGIDSNVAASCNEQPANQTLRGPVAGMGMHAEFGPAAGIYESDVLRMNSPCDAAVVELGAGCEDDSRPTNERRRVTAERSIREELRLQGGFAGDTLTTRGRIQHAQDRDIGRWKLTPMKTKLILALASIGLIMSMGCVAAAPRYHTYSLPKYQASVEVQAPIGDKPEVVARITFGELGGGNVK